MRDSYAGRSLLDASASRFFLESLGSDSGVATSAAATATSSPGSPVSPTEADTAAPADASLCYGNALGPRWVELLLEEADCRAISPAAASKDSVPPQERDIPPDQSGLLDMSSPLPGLTLLRRRELVGCRADSPASSGDAEAAWVSVADDRPRSGASVTAWGSIGVQCLLQRAANLSDKSPFTEKEEEGGALVVSADIVIAAVGVTPYLPFCPAELLRGPDGGLLVNKAMQVYGGRGSVFAAGDAASVGWDTATATATRASGSLLVDDSEVDLGGDHWFQMRLWTQARVLGAYTGARIAAHALTDSQRGRKALSDLELEGGYNLDLFAHCTSLGGFKVVLLGRFNGQGLDGAFEEAVSWLPGHHYMKLVLQGGRVVGAVLIGETDMEEAAERLIQGGHQLGDADLTDPDLDIDAILD